MIVALKRHPNAFEDWLSVTHPQLAGQVHFLEGPVIAQNDLNPFKARIIVIYVATADRYHLKGWLNYGEDTISPLLSLPKNNPAPKKQVILAENELTMDLVMERIDWIIFNGSKKRPFDEAFVLLQHIGPYVPEFYQLQMSKELANFRVEYDDEDDIANFLQRYGLSKCLHLMQEPPTLQDVQRVWHQWHPAKEPVVWILLPMEEMMDGAGLDLYPGGYYHVTLFDIAAQWVWKHLTHRTGKRRTTVHPEQMRLLIDHIQRRLVEKKQSGGSGRGPINSPSEDRLPPCVRSIFAAKRFPQDRERQLVVRILSSANVSLEYVRKRLEELNDRYPHGDGRKSAKARWDYEYHYKAKYAPPSCQTMGELCPLMGSLDQKKVACCKLFPGDNKPKNAKEFRGPANWFDW